MERQLFICRSCTNRVCESEANNFDIPRECVFPRPYNPPDWRNETPGRQVSADQMLIKALALRVDSVERVSKTHSIELSNILCKLNGMRDAIE